MKKLTFNDIHSDIERCCIDKGEIIAGTRVLRGYDESLEYVFNAYLEKKLYSAVVEYLLTEFNWHWGINDFVLKATDYLKQDRELSKLKRLWRGVIAVQKHHFWEMHALKNEANVEKSMSKVKHAALKNMALFRDILIKFEDNKELEVINEEISLLKREEQRKDSSKPNSRKINERLFWELIDSSRQSCESISEQINYLTFLLKKFKANEIRRFQKILYQRLRESFQWDLWALAYIAQNGCSDDAFEDFRAWLILQGQEVYELALNDIHKVIDKVPSGSGTQAESLLSVAAIAYESRTGKSLPPVKGSIKKLQGNSWKEEELKMRYPIVCQYFEYEA